MTLNQCLVVYCEIRKKIVVLESSAFLFFAGNISQVS